MSQEMPTLEERLSPDQLKYFDAIDAGICAGCYIDNGLKKPVNSADADSNRGCCAFSCYEAHIQGRDGLDYQATKARIHCKRTAEGKSPVGRVSSNVDHDNVATDDTEQQYKEAA